MSRGIWYAELGLGWGGDYFFNTVHIAKVAQPMLFIYGNLGNLGTNKEIQ